MKEHQKWYKERELGFKKRLAPKPLWTSYFPTRKERRSVAAPSKDRNVPITKALIEKYNIYKDFN